MYYELYIDVFFLQNFMLDSLLLMAVNLLCSIGILMCGCLQEGQQAVF